MQMQDEIQLQPIRFVRITVALERSEAEALAILARREVRDMRDEARILIRKALDGMGLLSSPQEGGR
jgi:hypothetical protein